MSDPKNVFITSSNQSGGVTAHTVNFGPTARAINDKLGAQLKNALPENASVCVVSVLGDSEAFGFANQVLAWLKGNGFPNVMGVDQAVYSGPVTGQLIKEKGPGMYEIIIGSRT